MHAILGTRGVARVVLRHTRSAHTLADGVASIDVDPGLDEILARGLERLPLDPRQRERARSLARDTSDHFGAPGGLACSSQWAHGCAGPGGRRCVRNRVRGPRAAESIRGGFLLSGERVELAFAIR